MNDYIDQCPFCQKFMTAKQIKAHVCKGKEFSGILEIPVRYIYNLTENGKRTVIAHAYDGNMYRLVETTNPAETPNRRKVTATSWEDKTDEDETEPDVDFFQIHVC